MAVMKVRAESVIQYLRGFQGAPYVYGGNGPFFDCSGLVCEGLKAFGLLGPKEDLTAAGLLAKFQDREVSGPIPGALVFFGRSGSDVTHVGIAVDEFRFLEAGGGDKTTKDIHSAVPRGAMVRERPLRSRSDLLGFYLPDYVTGN